MNRKPRLLIALLVFAGTSAPLLAAPESTSQNSFYEGRITGRVTDSAGNPVVGIEVTVEGYQPGDPHRKVETDSDGHYVAENLSTTAYRVWVDDYNYEVNYLPQAWRDFQCNAVGCSTYPLDYMTGVGVVSGEPTTGIDFVLRRPAWIYADFDDEYTSQRLVFDSNGDYDRHSVHGGLWPGTYYVVGLREEGYGIDDLYQGIDCPSAEDFPTCDPTNGTPVVLSEGDIRVLNMPTRHGGQIRGRAIDLSGGDNYDGYFRAWDAAGNLVAGSSGPEYYGLGDLPTGQYYVTVSANRLYPDEDSLVAQLYPGIPCLNPPVTCDPAAGEPISVIAGESTNGIDFNLPKGSTIIASIVSADTGEPVDDVEIAVWNQQKNLVATVEERYDGFVLPELAAGNYYVTTYSPSGTSAFQNEVHDGHSCTGSNLDSCNLAASLPITVPAGTTVHVDFSLEPYGGISGTLSHPLSRTVRAWTPSGEFAGVANVGPDSYSFSQLPPGSYYVSTQGMYNNDRIDELYPGVPCKGGPGIGCDLDDGDLVSFSLGENRAGVDFDLEIGGTITGQVRVRKSQELLYWQRVEAYDEAGNLVTWTLDFSDDYYHVSGLSSGQYYLAVVPYNPAFLSSSWGFGSCIACEPLAGTPIAVEAGQETAGFDFELDLATGSAGDGVLLLDGKFLVQGTMADFQDPPQSYPIETMTFEDGRAESDQAVFFESFSPGNFELGVKMVDACGLPDDDPLRNYWLFVGGLTNAESHIDIVDTVTGEAFQWNNPKGSFPETYATTQAFPCIPGPGSCSRSSEVACLLDGRFQISGAMTDFQDPPETFPARVMAFVGDGTAVTNQAAFFQSFTPGNFELGVKMVDACGLPQNHPQRGYWTFYGGLTNAGTEMSITQLATGSTDSWTVEPGTQPTSVGRVPAFDCE